MILKFIREEVILVLKEKAQQQVLEMIVTKQEFINGER